ncbi:MAG: hydroxyacid dehydrogenase [Promethearchaeota archaeon]|jgi:D-3-phosphoglycerate dehydrogenase
MRILISDKLREEGIKIFQENNFEIIKKFSISPEELKNEIENYDGIVIRSRTKLTADILEKATNLKLIGRAGVGLDNVDLLKAEELNIKVFNTPEAPAVSVSELTIGLLLSLVRHISKADQTMHCGEWCKSDYMGYVLKGKKIGLIGFGNIGQSVAKIASAMGMKIGIYDVDPNITKIAHELKYTVYPSVDDLVKDSQIISLHIPATAKTENTIDERRLKLMNKNTILINTARGNLIDEAALLKALENKEIGGAALDVYRKEPLDNMDLCGCEDNLILTPHIGSQTEETQIQGSLMIAEKMINYLKNL